MTTVFGLQITSRDDRELQLTATALQAAGLPYKDFGVIPFTDDITNQEAFAGVSKVLPLCGVKVLDMYLRNILPRPWHIYYTPNLFDQSQSMHFNWCMVNRDARFETFGKIRNCKFRKRMFVKPSNDRKMFAGLIVEAGQTLNDALSKTTHQELDDREIIIAAEHRLIGNEYRVFVVDNKVVCASQYRDAKGLNKKRADGMTLRRMIDYHESLHLTVTHPYVIDFAEVEGRNGLSIMELNCFNCSGMYDVDREAVFRAIAYYEGM